jgi:hypothetical protein
MGRIGRKYILAIDIPLLIYDKTSPNNFGTLGFVE